jgi:hypothetical protein
VGDVAWLTGLLAATGGLVAWLVKWNAKRDREHYEERLAREREISADWRAIAETNNQTSARQNEIIHWQNMALRRILAALEAAPWVATGPPGYGGYSAAAPTPTTYYGASSTPRHARPAPP